MKKLLVKDLLSQLNTKDNVAVQKRPEYIKWIGLNVVDIANEFVQSNKLLESYFIKDMNKTFKTTRFELLLNRWVVEYLLVFLNLIDDLALSKFYEKRILILEDCPLNRFGIDKYHAKFGVLPEIKWKKAPGVLQKIFSVLTRNPIVFCTSLNKGLKMGGKRQKYKIMREAIWGLYDVHGYYFHDDFLVDNDIIKKNDLLLFSRGVPTCRHRLKSYYDAIKSPYTHFNISSLSIGLGTLLSRVMPKYVISGNKVLFKEIFSPNFSLYWSIHLFFINNGLLYEKIFSHFDVMSEFGHNYFSSCHIVESIICQNYGTRYYLMHWSDHSILTNKYLLSFLGCDKFLTWGNTHVQGVKGESDMYIATGYVFKRFVKEAMHNKDRLLLDMGIKANGKIVSFFDESFGGQCEMTEGHFVTFWETALKLAEREKDSTILIKPKALERINNLSNDFKKMFLGIRDKIKGLPNIYIIDSDKWSFIETIGVSDIVVTQGVTSSSTIAIICGIEGLYLDEAREGHLFSESFEDKLVFYDPEKMISMIQSIIKGSEKPLKDIPEHVLRDLDAYADDRGIDLFRNILISESKGIDH